MLLLLAVIMIINNIHLLAAFIAICSSTWTWSIFSKKLEYGSIFCKKHLEHEVFSPTYREYIRGIFTNLQRVFENLVTTGPLHYSMSLLFRNKLGWKFSHSKIYFRQSTPKIQHKQIFNTPISFSFDSLFPVSKWKIHIFNTPILQTGNYDSTGRSQFQNGVIYKQV